MNHLRRCKKETYICPYGCIDLNTNKVSQIVGEFMNDHMEECDKLKVKCPQCEILFARD